MSETVRILETMLRTSGAPEVNIAVISQIASHLGIEVPERKVGYLKLRRTDNPAGPALNVHWGWTNGFRSRNEVEEALGPLRTALGPDDIWESSRGWGISHPENGGGRIATANTTVHDYGTCSDCNWTRAANGSCGC